MKETLKSNSSGGESTQSKAMIVSCGSQGNVAYSPSAPFTGCSRLLAQRLAKPLAAGQPNTCVS